MTDWEQGTYVWDSHALLDPARREAELEALQRAGMRRLYVGLDLAQTQDIARTGEAVTALEAAADARGMSLSLLLGDPHWMTEARRPHLIELLASLRELPFDALHLDLEVEQLGWPVPDARVQDWMDTLRDVYAMSPWPLEISAHHRWFEAAVPGVPCVPCALPVVGVERVSLMLYTRNADYAATRIAEIAERWPGLQFRLAQSVEDFLAPYETWDGASRAELAEQVDRWAGRLRPHGITGIDWQDWAAFPPR